MVGWKAILIKGHEFGEIGRKFLAAARAQGAHGIAIAARCPAYAEIDATGMQRF